MKIGRVNPYDVESHVAEIYDQIETQAHDLEFLKGLLGTTNCSRILEPFCGTGRILLPLAQEGYEIVGIDNSANMLRRFREKLCRLPQSAQKRVNITKSNLLASDWPQGFDTVLLAGNCLYELADAFQQQEIIRNAVDSLKPRGFLFVDNDNMEGALDESWCRIGVEIESFPAGVCEDGTRLQGYTRTTWIDRKKRIWRAVRRLEVIYLNGKRVEKSWTIQKHPVSADEVLTWLRANDMNILGVFAGTKNGRKFHKGVERATVWAQKK